MSRRRKASGTGTERAGGGSGSRSSPRELGLNWRIEFKLADMWIGAFWKVAGLPSGFIRRYDVWVCLLPCLPLHIWWFTGMERMRARMRRGVG